MAEPAAFEGQWLIVGDSLRSSCCCSLDLASTGLEVVQAWVWKAPQGHERLSGEDLWRLPDWGYDELHRDQSMGFHPAGLDPCLRP